MKVVSGPIHRYKTLEACGESGEATEVFRVAVQASLNSGVEDEVFVNLISEATRVVGFVAVVGDNADIFGVSTKVSDYGVSDYCSE